MVLAAVSWGPQDHPQIETVDRLTELRKATVLRVTIYYSASQQRERREGKRVCSSFWLSSLCRRSWCLWHDIFALLTLESLPLLELASPEPAFPARPLPVPSHWWLLPTFPPHPQCLLTHPGAPTCGSSWHGLPPPPVLQNTLLGDSHSTMLGGSDVWPYVWSMTANQEGSPEPWVLTPYDTQDNPPQQRTIFSPKCQYCWGWGTWTRDYRCFSVFILEAPRGLWDLSSATRDWTWATAVKAPNPNHWTTRELPDCEYVKVTGNSSSLVTAPYLYTVNFVSFPFQFTGGLFTKKSYVKFQTIFFLKRYIQKGLPSLSPDFCFFPQQSPFF